jgi:hypothetical protein
MFWVMLVGLVMSSSNYFCDVIFAFIFVLPRV